MGLNVLFQIQHASTSRPREREQKKNFKPLLLLSFDITEIPSFFRKVSKLGHNSMTPRFVYSVIVSSPIQTFALLRLASRASSSQIKWLTRFSHVSAAVDDKLTVEVRSQRWSSIPTSPLWVCCPGSSS